MKLFDLLQNTEQQSTAGRIYGAVVGIVTNNQDPDGIGRVKVKFPWMSDENESYWARVSTLMAGKDRGAYFLPEVDDEVLVVFEQGNVNFPYILGGLWNGNDGPPTTNSDGNNDMRVIKSRSGHVIRLNDKQGKETIEIIDKNDNSIVIDTAKNSLTITTKKDITLSAPQGTITLDAMKIAVKSSAQSTIEAGATMTVKANATMTIKGAIVSIN
jgi:uncharacterized protein involved in type VI secretion and phage assembly